MSIETQIQDLKQRQEALNTRNARVQFELENAKTNFEAARAKLKEEFGLSSGDEIKAKIAELEQARDSLMASIEADLEAAGA